MKQPAIFVFEGIDGCGKSTQAQMYHDYLIKKGVSCALIKDLRSSQMAPAIRQMVIDNPVSAENALTLVMAQRIDMLVNHVAPAIKEGKVIILDRYLPTTFALQCEVMGADYEKFNEYTRQLHEKDALVKGIDFTPSQYLFFMLSPRLAFERIQSRKGDTGEGGAFEKLDGLNKAHDAYVKMYNGSIMLGASVSCIHAFNEPDIVHQKVLDVITSLGIFSS